jgi:DNA-binding XRE family transcriptional regulator
MSKSQKATTPACRLIARRNKLDLSQRDLARLSGVALSTIRNLEQGRQRFEQTYLLTPMRLAVALRCPIHDLIDQGAWEFDKPAQPAPFGRATTSSAPRCATCGGAIVAGPIKGDRVCVSCGQEPSPAVPNGGVSQAPFAQADVERPAA